MEELKRWLEVVLTKLSVSGYFKDYLTALILIVLTLAVAFLALALTRQLLGRAVRSMVKRSPTRWDDQLERHHFFKKLSLLVVVLILNTALPLAFDDLPKALPLVSKLLDLYFLMVIVKIIVAFMNGTQAHLSASELFIEKPIASYFQLGRLLLYIGGAVLALSIVLGKSPIYFLGAFGAMTAVLLLVFKDTILGLVASVQISANDMIRVGDWVEMPKYNADGDVQAINLNTVKVMNWDNTITTVPTHYFITDSFKNWRGMQESGGRRIKRTLNINMSTIRFVDPELRETFKQFHLIRDYICQRQKEIESFNAKNQIDTSTLVNGRRMTNIGVFRKYIESYLRRHPGIHQDMVLMVRQMASTQYGVPLEIYCFTRSVAWADYEAVQSDIFDHLFAAARYFGLEVFQSATGADVVKAAQSLELV